MIRQATVPRISGPAVVDPQDPRWALARPIDVDQFRHESSDHRPQTSLRLLHDNEIIYGLFQVQDQYVRCTFQNLGDPVYNDSCVEFYAQPRQDRGYFIFEFNCGGTLLSNYITDETRIPGGFKEYLKLKQEDVQPIRVVTSMPKTIDPEIAEPTSWWLLFSVPVTVMEKFIGPVGVLSGQVWRGNAYKCGNYTSHPHWAAWSPVDQRNFHLPRCFGSFSFE